MVRKVVENELEVTEGAVVGPCAQLLVARPKVVLFDGPEKLGPAARIVIVIGWLGACRSVPDGRASHTGQRNCHPVELVTERGAPAAPELLGGRFQS
jgi:hypothetical protein